MFRPTTDAVGHVAITFRARGEGLVTHIEGPGTVYLQTKNLREFVD
jgi:uncharacterized protein (AIM24 family)